MTPHTPAGLPAVEKPRPRRLNPWFLGRLAMLLGATFLAGHVFGSAEFCIEANWPKSLQCIAPAVLLSAAAVLGVAGAVWFGAGAMTLALAFLQACWKYGKSPFRD